MLPLAGAVLFFFPLWFQYVKTPPTYPIKYANWIGLGWIVLGLVLTVVAWLRTPEKLKDMERVYVEDEFVTPVA